MRQNSLCSQASQSFLSNTAPKAQKHPVTHQEHSACIMLLYVPRMPGFGDKMDDTVWY